MRDLQADLEICNNATPGPWEWQENKWWGGHSGMTGKGDVSVLYPNHANDGDDGAAWFDDWENDNDRIFIAAAREGWPHAIERAIKAEAEVERLKLMVKSITEGLDEVNYAILLRKENLVIKTENEWLKRALSDIEDWCVEFHETGPHDPDKALKIVMNIYDIAYEQLGDRTELIKQAEKEGEK